MPVIVGKLNAEVDAIIGKEKRLLEQLNDYTIEIGVIAGESKERKLVSFGLTNAELMFIHENGSPVRNIPSRPVLQMTIDHVRNEMLDEFLDGCFEKIANNNWNRGMLEKELGKFCIRIQNYAQQIIYSNDGRLAPNAPSVAKKKGGNHPLFDTGQLARSLTCRYVKNA